MRLDSRSVPQTEPSTNPTPTPRFNSNLHHLSPPQDTSSQTSHTHSSVLAKSSTKTVAFSSKNTKSASLTVLTVQFSLDGASHPAPNYGAFPSSEIHTRQRRPLLPPSLPTHTQSLAQKTLLHTITRQRDIPSNPLGLLPSTQETSPLGLASMHLASPNITQIQSPHIKDT